jgi:integrase
LERLRGRTALLARYVLPEFGSRRISTIQLADVEAWIARLAATPTGKGTTLHPSTIRHAFIAANKVFKHAARHRLISHNPATGASLPRIQHEQRFEPLFLTPAEVEALAGHLASAHPDDLFVRFAAYTGLRAGEMLGLQVRDINLFRRTVDVRRTLTRTAEGWREDVPKTVKSIRTVPLRRALAEELAGYLAGHPYRDDPTAALWPGRNYAGGGEWRGGLTWDKRMDYESFYRRRFRAAAAAIDRPGLRFHDLRHTAGSLFAASGMPLARVARVLGHSDTATTYKTYLHFFPDDFAADMDRLDAYLAPAPAPEVTPLRRTAEQ